MNHRLFSSALPRFFLSFFLAPCVKLFALAVLTGHDGSLIRIFDESTTHRFSLCV